jgi:hypothetical protein
MKANPARPAPPSPDPEVQRSLTLNDRLGLISLIDEGIRLGSSDAPVLSDLFNDLWELVNTTVSGSKIDRLKPEHTYNGFRVFEINAETGENLGRLNMLYLNKPMPCYYLVYVEVAAPYRKNGLGNRILEYFRDFLIRKSAVGILDNIIPREDPTYDIYDKQAWEPVDAIIGDAFSDACENYMIFIPPKLKSKDLRDPVLRLVHHLNRKRPAIDMRDNQMMVQRTIAEFRELYSALLVYFEGEIASENPSPLMRFMFTRFVTKLISFRRRISDLIGYTGGDSLEQITLSPQISKLEVQSYMPSDLATESTLVAGDRQLWLSLPEAFRVQAAPSIQSLPNYRRPTLAAWMQRKGIDSHTPLTLGDLLDLGFDPTRLKEFTLGGEEYIFERIQARQIPNMEKTKGLLERIETEMPGARVSNARLRVNPPLLVIRDLGTAYVLRRKVAGVHWEEAVEQLQSSAQLKGINAAMRFDATVLSTVRTVKGTIGDQLALAEDPLLDLLTCFVSWDLEANRPGFLIDFSGTFLHEVWVA